MNLALMIAGLALVWAAITGNFTALNLLLGAFIGAGTALLLRTSFASPHMLRRLRRIVVLFLVFLWELMLSAMRVAIMVLQPDLKAALRPAIIAYPLTVKSDGAITLLANMITLTPGTLSIDVAQDRSVIYVHVLHLDDREALIAGIAGSFERRIQEIFQ